MPRVASFTIADVLDRGIVAVPDVLTALPDAAVGTRDDVDVIVKNAFSKAKLVDIDRSIIDSILDAGDPLDRATAVISAKHAALGSAGGVLGETAGGVAVCQDGFGYYRHFRSGSIFWHPAAGAHEVHGPIRAKWAALGWERSVLGYPTSDQLPGSDPDQRGAYNTFQGGAIHWYPPGFAGLLTGIDVVATQVVLSDAAAKPKRTTKKALAADAARAVLVGGTVVGEALGSARTVATAATLETASRVVAINAGGIEAEQLLGRFDEIGSRGAVILPVDQPTVLGTSAGAFEVHGDIGVHYRALGGSGSVLGYPTTDETGTPDGVGRYNHFQAGSIYWTPSTGAHETHGLIRSFWAAGGWERNSALGYPISDELVPDRRIGHRFPERRKKDFGLPPDVIKLPADAVVAGFSPTVANLPQGEVLIATPAATRVTAAARGRLKASAAVGAVADAAVVALPGGAAKHAELDGIRVDLDKAHFDLGQLITDPSSTVAPVASDNRFGDFENGVVFWRRGSSAARQLQPWATSADGRIMKRTPAEVAAAFDAVLAPALAGLDRANYTGTSFLGTTGYSWDGATIHNRGHRMGAAIMATQSLGGLFGGGGTIPAVVTVSLRLETVYDPQRRTVVVYLADWSYTDSANLTAPSLLRQLHPRLDALLYRRVDLIEVPDADGGDPIALLSAKTLPDGTVVIYIEPNDPLIVTGAITTISDALRASVVINR